MMLALWAAVTFCAPVVPGVVERGAHDPLRAEHRDGLDRDAGVLADAGSVELLDEAAQCLGLLGVHLVLDAGVEVLGVLAHDHEVGLGEAGAHARVGLARPDACVQVELLAQQHVDRAKAGADRRGGRPLDADLRALDRVQRAVGERRTLGGVDVLAGGLLVPLELARPLASSTRRVASTSSGPVPSPGIRVTSWAIVPAPSSRSDWGARCYRRDASDPVPRVPGCTSLHAMSTAPPLPAATHEVFNQAAAAGRPQRV